MSSALRKLNLRPFERRLLVATAVVVFLVVNLVWVMPHFKDWGATKARLENARADLEKFRGVIAQKKQFEGRVMEMEAEGQAVSPEDQANQFLRDVQSQAAVSGVIITSISRSSTRTNEFFLEQLQTFQVQAREEQLVDFLYELGSGDSMIRARGLSFRPSGNRQQLSGSIDLVASYQKKPAASKPAPTTKNKTSTVKKP